MWSESSEAEVVSFSCFFDLCDVATVVGDVEEGPKAENPEYNVTVTQ